MLPSGRDSPTPCLRERAELSGASSSAIVRDAGVTAVVATHDPAILDVADRVTHLHDGRIVDDG